MFRSLKWKLMAVFVLLMLVIMTVAGAFLVLRVSYFYHDMFTLEIGNTLDESFVSGLEDGALSDENYISTGR